MSHGDHVTEVPPGFHVTALTDDALERDGRSSRAAFMVCSFIRKLPTRRSARRCCATFCFLFVVVAVIGRRKQLSKNKSNAFAAQLGDEGRVVSGLSGGVDSTVAAALVHQSRRRSADLYLCRQWSVA